MKNVVRLFCFLLIMSAITPLWSQEKVDLETMSRIRYEGFHNSKVMDYATGLMDSIGERLTGSPNMKRANEWTRDQLAAIGLSNSHLEPWGPFGRGWANQYVNARMTSPDIVPLLVYAKAWTPGTNGVVSGKCIRVIIEDKKDFDKYKGKLAGMIVILGADPEVKPITELPYKRYSDDDLSKLADYQIPPDRSGFNMATYAKRLQFIKDLNQFFADEKVLAVVDRYRGTAGGGTVFVQSGGSYKPGETTTVPQLVMAIEHWSRIARLLQQKKDVSLELNVSNTFYDDDPMQYDTVAEIPGTDKKEEVVMLGAHLDSWHAGTGATDNGAGTIVMMEAVRILKALDVHPRRTIRIGLWTGEEEGLLGSQGYVEHHFGSRPPMDDPQMKGMPTLLRREAGEVTVKPEQAFFFAAPQADADGAAGLDVQGFQDANGLHHDNRSGAVIGGSGAGVPGVKMRTEHHDLVFLVFIRAGNFGDGVVLHWIIVVKGVIDVQFQGDVFVLLQQSSDARPMLNRHNKLGDGRGLARFIRAS